MLRCTCRTVTWDVTRITVITRSLAWNELKEFKLQIIEAIQSLTRRLYLQSQILRERRTGDSAIFFGPQRRCVPRKYLYPNAASMLAQRRTFWRSVSHDGIILGEGRTCFG